jgi:hypothetical protein
MVAAFGFENLEINSPALWPIHARVLAAVGETDTLIPFAQMTTLRDNMLAADPSAYVDVARLSAGPMKFVHTTVSQNALDDLYSREEALVAPLG